MIAFGSAPFILAVIIAWAIMSGRLSLGSCVVAGIWCGFALVLAALTLGAIMEKSVGKPFADADLRFCVVGSAIFFGLPWLLRRRR